MSNKIFNKCLKGDVRKKTFDAEANKMEIAVVLAWRKMYEIERKRAYMAMSTTTKGGWIHLNPMTI